MYIPELNIEEEYQVTSIFDATDTICDLCPSQTKCSDCGINDIKDQAGVYLNEILKLPEDQTRYMKYIGKIRLGESCDLTDPCYSKDVWCRNTINNMLPGNYNCYAIILADEDITQESIIIHDKYDNTANTISTLLTSITENLIQGRDYSVGVDAGLFGYFDNKPDFSDEEWHNFCGQLKGEAHITKIMDFRGRDGFVTESGYGDGGYTSTEWIEPATGKVAAVNTLFVSPID